MTCSGFEITVTSTPCVNIYIRGEGGDFPVCPRDGGLILRFLTWANENAIYPVVRGGCSGGGLHVGFYSKGDADRILDWRQEAAAMGLCYICRCRVAKLGKRSCQECLDRNRIKKARWGLVGRCVRCGRRAEQGARQCRGCLKKNRERTIAAKERRRKRGLCSVSDCPSLANPGRRMCEQHRIENLDRVNAERAERKALGLCQILGCNDNAADGHVMCNLHLERLRTRKRKAT